MAENRYVKCEDCGRRLPGPPKRCDVCGGKMTYRAEESYYTPEGIINKSHHSKSPSKTPGGDKIRNAAKQKRRPPQKKTSSKPAMNSGSYNTSENSLIDRIGDAVDILAGADEVNVDSLKEMGKALTGNKSKWSNISKNTSGSSYNSNTSGSGAGSSDDKHSYTNQRKSLIVKYGAGIAVFVVVILILGLSSIGDDGYDDYGYDEDGNYYDDYDYDSGVEYFDMDEVVNGDGYSLNLYEINYEGDEDMTDYLYAFFAVEITGDKDIEISPFSDVALEFDKEAEGELVYINITNEVTDEDESFYAAGETMTLEAGEEYFFMINYDYVESWDELTLIHNFNGDLESRNKELDITVNRSESQTYGDTV